MTPGEGIIGIFRQNGVFLAHFGSLMGYLTYLKIQGAILKSAVSFGLLYIYFQK
jgi:hypothetical protein